MGTNESDMKEALWLLKNMKEITAPLDITTADIMEALRKQNIDPTPRNIEKVAQHLRFLASFYIKAVLQEEKDWRAWLE